MRLSLIIPFHRNLDHLQRCLAGVKPASPDTEILVVADGAVDDCAAVAAANGAKVVTVAGPSGPAVARNVGAGVATGDILVFIDADVVASAAVLARVEALFASRPDVSAAFGAYDDQPAEPNLVSQYKNLAHSYIHQMSNPVAQTFWAGFGAVRAQAFREVGGFDERFRRPSVEDIELGYRLTAAGHLVWLDPQLRVCHLKRWTFRSLLRSDIVDRGIPWTQLILRFGRVHDDLNLRNAYRVSVILSYASVGFLVCGLVAPMFLIPALLAVGSIYLLNREFFAYFVRDRGALFALRIAPLHGLFHLYNGLSFLVGSTLYLVHRWLGIRLPGAVPLSPWEGSKRVRRTGH